MAGGDDRAGRFGERIAVVIGGSSGLGLGAAERLVAEGASVVIGGRRGEVAAGVGERLGGWGLECDITDDSSLSSFVGAVLERHGRMDVAINCAGFAESVGLAELTPDKLEPMVAVQLTGAIAVMRHCCEAMADSGGGAFLSVSSLTAHRPAAGQIAYGASKAGLEFATEIAALEYGPKGVRVNTVAPALVETPMTAGLFAMDLVVEAMRVQTPLGRMGTVDDVVGPMLFMLSDDACFITGQTLLVDGGTSTQKLPAAADYANLARLRPELVDPTAPEAR